MSHLLPTTELAERALLPDDPGQALALARLLFEAPPLMFNHHRGLWGYSGVALDGAPLTIQSTGVGGPSAAVVVGELHALGLQRAIRVGRGWALTEALHAGAIVAASEVVASDGVSRALGAGARVGVDPAMLETLAAVADATGLIASGDLVAADPAWAQDGVLVFDLESAAVLAAAAQHSLRAAVLVAIDGAAGADEAESERVSERLGRAALGALAL